jgi:hypothetical protein
MMGGTCSMHEGDKKFLQYKINSDNLMGRYRTADMQ